MPDLKQCPECDKLRGKLAAMREGLGKIKASHENNVCHCHSYKIWDPLLATNAGAPEAALIKAAIRYRKAEQAYRTLSPDILSETTAEIEWKAARDEFLSAVDALTSV